MTKYTYIDLTHTLSNNTPVYPGDHNIRVSPTKTIEKDSYRDSKLELSMHVGTHMDTKGHFLYESDTINNYDLNRFILPVHIIDVRGTKLINLTDTIKKQIIPNEGIILYTGFDQYYKEDVYYKKHPVITKDFANYLVQKNIPLLGMDLPSPDHAPYDIHNILLSNDTLLLENLTNLHKLLHYHTVTLLALPLKLKTYGAPVRAIAMVSNERTI